MTEPRRIKISDVRHCVGIFYGITREQMVGPSLVHKIAHPRQVGMALARELTKASFPAIAVVFGRHDHTTVLYACRTVARRAADDPDFSVQLNTMRGALRRLQQPLCELVADPPECILSAYGETAESSKQRLMAGR